MVTAVSGVSDSVSIAWRVSATSQSAVSLQAREPEKKLPSPDEMVVKAVAERIGVNVERVQAERAKGKSLTDIAREHGVPREAMVALMNGTFTVRNETAKVDAPAAPGAVSPALVRQAFASRTTATA